MRLTAILILTFAATCAAAAQEIRVADSPAELPAGYYREDASHTTVVFRVDHLGFSNYTASFGEVGISANLDPSDPSAATLDVTIPVRSLQLPSPPEGFRDMLLGPEWFDAEAHPDIRFVSTDIEMTGERTANIHGDLTLHGITRPVTLAARYNGGWAGHVYDPNARIGFSATAEISRSDFGMGFGTPSEAMPGVSDTVHITIQTELTGPEWTPPQAD